ncbi:MAG: GGDEF domain-containing protein [Proteobacteria bacterium]|nr:GGDEF domain-containing protein [Pseudomonadota bacterium]
MADDKTIIADPGSSIFSSPKKTAACLVQYSGTNLGKRYILDQKETVVGRSPTVEIVVNEQSVSRAHAQCQQQDDDIYVADLGSSNGTYVNDKKITGRQILRDGDIIRLGNIVFKFFAQGNVENVFHDKIYRMATIDAGTNIFNKKYLIEALETEVKFSKAYSRPLSIIYFDLDFFKKVNDTYGHGVGDIILKETSTLVKSMVRKSDIFCRYGGEEFVILLPSTDAKTAYELAERIRSSFGKSWRASNRRRWTCCWPASRNDS